MICGKSVCPSSYLQLPPDTSELIFTLSGIYLERKKKEKGGGGGGGGGGRKKREAKKKD